MDFYIFALFTDLTAFLKSITGCQDFLDKPIYIHFHRDSGMQAFSTSACSSQLEVSTLIEINDIHFMAAFKAITNETDFTML